MIFDRHLTPGDGQADVEICGCPYHGLARYEQMNNTAINGGAPLQYGADYQLGVSASWPQGLRNLQALVLNPSFTIGPYGDVNFQIWFDAEAGIIQPRHAPSFPSIVTASFLASFLTLPNGVELNLPKHPGTGDTYKLQAPGVAPVSRSPADAARDALNGYQWLDHLVMSGNSGLIYASKYLGIQSWIYCAADGTKWRGFMAVSSQTLGAPPTLTHVHDFTFTRFDGLDSPPATYTSRYEIVDSSAISSPDISFYDSGTAEICTVFSQTTYLEDVRLDGAQAVFGWKSNCPEQVLNNQVKPWLGGDKIAVLYTLVNLSGSGASLSASVSVLHNRAETLGSYTKDAWGVKYDDRIIGVWFNDAGVPLPVKLSRHFPTNTVETAIPPNTSGTWTATSIADFTWTFTWGTQSAVFSAEMTHVQEKTCVAVQLAIDPPEWDVTITCRQSSSMDFEGITGAAAMHDTVCDNSYLTGNGVVAHLDGMHVQSWQLFGTTQWLEYPSGAYHGSGYIHGMHMADVGTGNSVVWAIKRLSNKYFGLLAMKYPVVFYDLYMIKEETRDMVWIGGFSPSGKDGGPQTLGFLEKITPSGSFNPTTGAVHLQPNGKQVCFV